MSKISRVESHFSGGAESPELDHYRPISPLVVVACVAALASLLAVVHPLLWIVPAVAVLLSVSAIIRLSSPQSRHGGRNAAVAALCLAALIGSYAPARTISRDRALFAESRAKTDEWLSLVQQGRVQEAHQLTQNSFDRFSGPGSLASHYAYVPPQEPPSASMQDLDMPPGGGQSPADQLKEFVAWPVVAKLLELGDQSRVEHLRSVEKRFLHGDLEITQRYRLSGLLDGQSGSTEFLIRATRHEDENFASWKVGQLQQME